MPRWNRTSSVGIQEMSVSAYAWILPGKVLGKLSGDDDRTRRRPAA